MRWPWHRRRGGRVVFLGGSPFDAIVASFPTPPVAAWLPEPEPVAVQPVAAAAAVAPRPPVPRVQLGFADGSVVTLDDDDPRSRALRDIATNLARTDAARA